MLLYLSKNLFSEFSPADEKWVRQDSTRVVNFSQYVLCLISRSVLEGEG